MNCPLFDPPEAWSKRLGRPSSRHPPAATARRGGQGMKPLRRARQRASLDRSEHRGTAVVDNGCAASARHSACRGLGASSLEFLHLEGTGKSALHGVVRGGLGFRHAGQTASPYLRFGRIRP